MTFVVFAGQSNALGFGMTAETVPAAYASADPLTYIWNNYIGGFEMLQPGVNTGTVANPGAWGPEVAFAHEFRLAHPSEPLFIVKSVKGSTGLAQDPDELDWSPASHDEMFDLTAARVNAARADLNSAPVDAVFFVQGEQDGFAEAKAEAYACNLEALFGAIRSDWMGDDAGQILFARVGAPGFEAVAQAQAEVDEADPHAASFAAADLAMQDDALHYAAEGYLAIGTEFSALFDPWSVL